MHPQTFADAKALFRHTKRCAQRYTNARVVVAPPAVFLYPLARGYRGKRIDFAAQSILWEEEGSYTGEVSAPQVRDAGATYAIIGHAEQRARGVDDEEVRKKVPSALRAGLMPIVAVGEQERDESGAYMQALRAQITAALVDAPPKTLKDVIIAYEPVWAVGAPKAPDAHAVHQMMLLVRKIVAETYDAAVAKRIRVLYGGAVDETSATDILHIPDISGVLIGRASLVPEKVEAIVAVANIT